jgi:uncharacterized membrane protein YeaQ/YmgE (transglycosylase-associated protein family)
MDDRVSLSTILPPGGGERDRARWLQPPRMAGAAELPARLRAPGFGRSLSPRPAQTTGADDLSILAWIALGTIADLVTSKLASGRGQGGALDLTLGITGAIVGGFLFDLFGAAAAAGSDASGVLAASLGSVALLAAHPLAFNRRASA